MRNTVRPKDRASRQLTCYLPGHKWCPDCRGCGRSDIPHEFDSMTFYTDIKCPTCDGKGAIPLDESVSVETGARA